MKNVAALVAVLALAAADAARAQAPPPVALTLEEATARALAESHRIAEARARERGAQAAVDESRTLEKPTVTLSGGYTRTNHVDIFGVVQPSGQLRVIYPDIPDNYFARAALQWPIYTFGRADALERAAAAEARAAGAELQATQADLRLEVARGYWALVTANESVRVLREAVERAATHLRDVRAMLQAGLISPSDVSFAEAQRSREQVRLIDADNMRRSVIEDLRRLTGIAAEADIVPVERLAPTTSPGAPAAAEPIALALKQRPERQVLLQRSTAADERAAAAAAGKKPTVAAGGTFDYANPNPRIFPRQLAWRESWDVTVNVSWPIWDSGRSKAEAAQAAAAALALRERLADLDNGIATEIRQRQLDIASALAAIGAADDGLRSALEATRVIGERFRVGVATNTEVLDAQVASLEAELDRTRALANLRLAEARLERALGR